MVWSLAFTQIVSWGVLFYAFPVLAAGIAADEGWSSTTLFGIFTVAQLVAAALGTWVGRHIDHLGPRGLMTAGSVLAVTATVAIAVSGNLLLFAASWLLAGVAMSATLYPPAFAAVTHWAGPRRVRALTTVTLVGGLASTVFAPLAAVLSEAGDWRTTYLVLAAVLATTIPAHWWGLRHPWHKDTAGTAGTGRAGPDSPDSSDSPVDRLAAGEWTVRGDERGMAFALLVAAFALAGFCIFAVVVNLVPLLVEGGLSTADAATALAAGGVGQVAGRLFYGPALSPFSTRTRTAGVFITSGLMTWLVAAANGSVAFAVLASFLAGITRGLFTLVQATAVSDRWGTGRYGESSGTLSASVTATAALAPWAGAVLATALGGYQPAFLLLGAGAILAALMVRPDARTAGELHPGG